ncbi:MAG: HAMP domain-containing sensor histidine kinase [Eubacteriales bacterium]
MSDKKTGLLTSIGAKIIAFIGVIMLSIFFCISAIASCFMWEQNFTQKDKEELYTDLLGNTAQWDMRKTLEKLINDDSEAADIYIDDNYINVSVKKDGYIMYERNDYQSGEWEISTSYYHWEIEDDFLEQFNQFEDSMVTVGEMDGRLVVESQEYLGLIEETKAQVAILIEEANQKYEVTLSASSMYASNNQYYFISKWIDLAYPLRYSMWWISICSLLGGISGFAFLMYGAGWRKEEEEVTLRGMCKIPLDLYVTICGGICIALLATICRTVNYFYYEFLQVLLVIVASILCLIILLFMCMNFTVRIKVGKWWRNTLLFIIFTILIRGSKKIFVRIKRMIERLPLIWKSFLFSLGASIFLVMGGTVIDESILRMLFLAVCCFFICNYIFYIMALLKKFKLASEALAGGNLSYQVDTKYMPKEFQEAGENLNTLALGLTKAVEEQMKSERMKTELITNVSHDIKTPLTSIINYSDLIREQKTDNMKIQEYSEVLFRQSNRLKKLIEDLVEASKASSGNIEMLLEPCEVGVLLTQIVGEYEQKLEDKKLFMITKQPEEVVRIMADGRRLWRVLDNLLNNICKYAQENTRVYLNVEEKNGKAIISLKNISRYPLDISEEELMERFVRGDHSRHSEGNGLGLSIAESLTQLQGGTLSLTIDGDLFKVVLVFDSL